MPQNPDFSRKMMSFDGRGLGLTSATLRCTNQTHVRYLEILGTATCVCVFIAVFIEQLFPFL